MEIREQLHCKTLPLCFGGLTASPDSPFPPLPWVNPVSQARSLEGSQEDWVGEFQTRVRGLWVPWGSACSFHVRGPSWNVTLMPGQALRWMCPVGFL